MQIYNNIDALLTFDYFLLDVWGVLFDGHHAYPDSAATLQKLIWHNKTIILLSNTPSRAAVLKDELRCCGIADSLYHGIMTSGEVLVNLLSDKQWCQENNIGTRYYYIGPDERKNLLQGLAYVAVDDLAACDFILTCGFNADDQIPSDYAELFNAAARRDIPLLCASPDIKITTQAGKPILCAGALAKYYEAVNGKVHYIGKPFPLIYQLALQLMPGIDHRQIVAIGDGLHTDVLGALNANIHAVLLMNSVVIHDANSDGIHDIMAYCQRQACCPAGILTHFVTQ